ncbi:hypothetical protein, partial [Deinococcus sp.]|uniref:hypothetical protein n=1 Tax=Deinococcus sp. TaxID=47478 RepID=UPI0028699CAA
INLHALESGCVLHTRFLKVHGEGLSVLTMTGGMALAHGNGPLNVTRFEVHGVPEPTTGGGQWLVQDDRWDIRLPADRVWGTPGGWVAALD